MNKNIMLNINLVRIFQKHLALLFISSLFFYSSLMVASENNAKVEKPIRIVMSAAFVSDSGLDVYNDIFHYLGKKLGRKVEFVSGFSYATINTMLDTGMVDLGFICGLPYTMKKDIPRPTIDLLLAPVMKDPKYKDKPVYFSYIIVNKNSKFNNFKDLKNSRFVFTDEISNSGYNMPRAHLIDIGETSGFFSKVSRSGSHEESIRLVAMGKADVSAVDSLVYDYDILNNPKHVQQTKIIKVLGPAGIPPIVISTKTSLLLRKKIQNILIGMKDDLKGKSILDKALVDRFIIVDDSNYDGIRRMNKKSLDAGYKVIH